MRNIARGCTRSRRYLSHYSCSRTTCAPYKCIRNCLEGGRCAEWRSAIFHQTPPVLWAPCFVSSPGGLKLLFFCCYMATVAPCMWSISNFVLHIVTGRSEYWWLIQGIPICFETVYLFSQDESCKAGIFKYHDKKSISWWSHFTFSNNFYVLPEFL